MGNEGPLVGMSPEPAHVLKELATMIDERIGNGDDTSLAIARFGSALQPLQTAVIERLCVPGLGTQPAMQARLVGRDGKLTINATDILALSDHQSSHILGEMLPSGFIGKEVTKNSEGVLHNRGKIGMRASSLRSQGVGVRDEEMPSTIRQPAHFAKVQS